VAAFYFTMVIEVVIFNGPPQALSYLPPADFEGELKAGMRVLVPLGRRKAPGLIISTRQGDDQNLRAIDQVIDHRPLLNEPRIAIAIWISRYYHAPLRDVLNLFLLKAHTTTDSLQVYSQVDKKYKIGSNLKHSLAELLKNIVSRKAIKLSTVRRRFDGSEFLRNMAELESMDLVKIGFHPKLKNTSDEIRRIQFSDPQEMILNSEQQRAFETIREKITAGTFAPYLLFGVTGSGKSELYLKLIWETLRGGKTALLTLPEIASSEELYRKLKNKLGDLICRIHSGLKASERLQIWENIREGRYRAVIGPRSALFSPLPDPGLIIVDEEHDSSYKQSGSQPYYHGRDLALVMGREFKCPVILGTATPSLESWYNAATGKYELLRLKERWDSRPLPVITPIEYTFSPTGSSLSDELLEEMRSVLKSGGQVMLLLNRRGFAPTVKCDDCGFTYTCPNCSVGLVYHKHDNSLRCHLCDFRSHKTETCSQCGGAAFVYFGVGTQKLEEEIQVAFPKSEYARIDLDTAADRKSLKTTLDNFRQGKIKILIGTQMIAKSFDFPQVSLMGILSADSYLEFPDFRSREKTFALLLQAAGRAGRGKFPGRVSIQHSVQYADFISSLNEEKVTEFLEQEAEARHELNFPPYCHLILINLKSPGLRQGEAAVTRLVDMFQHNQSKFKRVFEYFGPSRAPLFKLRNNYRWQILIKTKAVFKTLDILDRILSGGGFDRKQQTLRVSIDVDPVDML
jgi:primosomal protein N' (replication factor Y)